MSNTLYNLFRGIIGDLVSPYTIPDLRILKYLDEAIKYLSALAPYKMNEDVVITSADISAGYKDLSKEILLITSTNLPYEGTGWQVDKGKRIRFINTTYVSAGTYRFEYNAIYKKYDGALRDDDYFDYPTPEADIALIFYALALYQQETGVIDKDGAMKFVKSKSEEGMSITYGALGTISETIGAPETLKMEATKIMKNLANGSKNLFFSVRA